MLFVFATLSLHIRTHIPHRIASDWRTDFVWTGLDYWTTFPFSFLSHFLNSISSFFLTVSGIPTLDGVYPFFVFVTLHIFDLPLECCVRVRLPSQSIKEGCIWFSLFYFIPFLLFLTFFLVAHAKRRERTPKLLTVALLST